MPPFADWRLTVSSEMGVEMCQRTCPNFARPVVAERFLASPEDLRMAEGILYGGSVISISVVGVRPVQELFPGRGTHESELVDCSARQNKQFTAHQAIDDLEVAVTGRIFGCSSDLS
jgi:hypothetical protein